VTALPLLERGDVRVVVPVDASPTRAWDAYTRAELRRRWMRMPGERLVEELDLTEGGHERLTSDFEIEEGRREHLEYASHFLEIVPGHRITWAFAIRVDGLLRAASLATVRFGGDVESAEVVHEEQFTVFAATPEELAAGVAERRGGTRLQLNGFRGVAGGA
jgi:uncharacterized protein YndB with AHSA1/START domain